MSVNVLGLDMSLTSTGAAIIEDGVLTDVFNIKTKGKKLDDAYVKLHRIHGIVSDVCDWVDDLPIDMVVIEGPSFSSVNGQAHERGHLWWLMLHEIAAYGRPGARPDVVSPSPASRSKYITGYGRADKETVLAHAIHYYQRDDGPRIANHDIADAVGLAAMGSRYLGFPAELYEMDLENLQAMEKVAWP